MNHSSEGRQVNLMSQKRSFVSHHMRSWFTCSQGLLCPHHAHANPSRSTGTQALGYWPKAGWEGSTFHREGAFRITISLLIPIPHTQLFPNGAQGLKGTTEGPSCDKLFLPEALHEAKWKPWPTTERVGALREVEKLPTGGMGASLRDQSRDGS